MAVQRRAAQSKPVDPPAAFGFNGYSTPSAAAAAAANASNGADLPVPHGNGHAAASSAYAADKNFASKHRASRNRKLPLYAPHVALVLLFVAWFYVLRTVTFSIDGSDDRSTAQVGRTASSQRFVRTLFQNSARALRPSKAAVSVPKRPRVMAVYFESATHSVFNGMESLDPNQHIDDFHNSQGIAFPHDHPFDGFPETEEQREFQSKRLTNSKKYRKGMPDIAEDEKCKLQHDWQREYHPNCNLVQEQDLTAMFDPRPKPRLLPSELDLVANDGQQKHYRRRHYHRPIKYLAAGYYRDVWRLATPLPEGEDDGYGGRTVLKTLRWEHDFTQRNFDRHRRDALTMEQLTPSPHIMDIYAFCSNSGVFEYADGRSLDDAIFGDALEQRWSPREQLIIAHQAASGVAAVHNIDREGVASIAHTDISPSQFVLVQKFGIYKLNDFNRARFINRYMDTDHLCAFFVSNNKGKFRSPEEYIEPHVETEKVDVYSLGNILYIILTGWFPFNDVEDEEAQKLVSEGKRPSFSKEIMESKDPHVEAMMKAIQMCWVQDPKERATARAVQIYLDKKLNELGVEALPDGSVNEGHHR